MSTVFNLQKLAKIKYFWYVLENLELLFLKCNNSGILKSGLNVDATNQEFKSSYSLLITDQLFGSIRLLVR